MSDKQIWLCISLWFLLILVLMIWNIRKEYIYYSMRYKKCSKYDNFKSALKVFFNGRANTAYASVLLILFIIPFYLFGTAFGAIVPLIVLKILCILSGIVFTYYFFQSFFNTIKSIKKEKFKTTIKAKWQGILSFFVFVLFVYAYAYRWSHN